MPAKYLVEMFCDRIAACRVYKGRDYMNSDPLKYYKERRERMLIHENTRRELEKMLEYLATCGEKEAFKYARKILKQSRKKF